MTSRPKTQHFVPQFFLSRFCHVVTKKGKTRERIHLFDLRERKTAAPSLVNVACVNRFYRVAVGDELVYTIDPALERLESRAAPAIERLVENRDTTTLADEDRHAIALFVAVQSIRGPVTRRSIEELPRLLAKKFQGSPQIREALERHAEDLRGDGAAHMHFSLIEDFAKLYLPLAERSWQLLAPPKGKRFCTSDCPVIRYNVLPSDGRGNLGLMSKGVVFELALAPDLGLAIIEPPVHMLVEGTVTQMSDDNLLFYNDILIQQADRFLYARDASDFDVPEGLWEDGPKMKVE